MQRNRVVAILMIIAAVMLIITGCSTKPEIPEENSGGSDGGNQDKVVEQDKEIDYIVLSNQYTLEFYKGDLKKLHDSFSPKMKKALSLRKLKSFKKQVVGTYGELKEVTSETIDDKSTPPFIGYLGITTHTKYEGDMYIQFFLNNEGIIEGFYIKPKPVEVESDYLDYQTKTELRLPFKGVWYVVWGGRSVDDNYHAAYSDQRFATDIVIVKDGKSYKTDGKTNEDYYAFGQTLYAPGSGKIVAMENNVQDNVPGVMNANNVLGNYIIIDHLNGEYSIMAHFKRGTVKVAVGDEVKLGQDVGLCGNSGNSSEAHIHYHMQNTKVFGNGVGLPAFFKDYIADGKTVESGEPQRGQIIEN